MPLSPAARKKLGEDLAEIEGQTIRVAIRNRGGGEANLRKAGTWADKTLAEAAEAAVQKDLAAAKAIKIVKQAKRLGKKRFRRGA